MLDELSDKLKRLGYPGRCGEGECDRATGVCRCKEGTGGGHCELSHCMGTTNLEVECNAQLSLGSVMGRFQECRWEVRSPAPRARNLDPRTRT